MICCILAFLSSTLCFLLSFFRCELKRERIISFAISMVTLLSFAAVLYWHHTAHHEGHHVEGHQH
jgi:uncharacterized membrane protein